MADLAEERELGGELLRVRGGALGELGLEDAVALKERAVALEELLQRRRLILTCAAPRCCAAERVSSAGARRSARGKLRRVAFLGEMAGNRSVLRDSIPGTQL
jgi:hypothetical protein